MIRAGRLDRHITIQRRTVTDSDSGAQVETWSTLVNRRPAGLWTPRQGSESFSEPQLVARERVEWLIRYSSDVADLSPLDRVIYPALGADSPQDEPAERDVYDIVAVHEAHELGRYVGLRLVTARRPDVSA